jgi:acyl-CoA synthetase (AMP-forming)/AMP-acid ligase II
MTDDAWFRTGDLGYLDEDGYLFIVDRKKDIIIRGGENITASEVEAALYAHPGIAEASVFGLPDERLGEVPVAVFVAHEGADVSGDDLREFLGAQLAAFKIPVHFWQESDRLPRLGTEKVDKRSLKARYAAQWAGADKRA